MSVSWWRCRTSFNLISPDQSPDRLTKLVASQQCWPGRGRVESLKVLVTTSGWIVSTWVYTETGRACTMTMTQEQVAPNTLNIYSNISPQLSPISRYLANPLKGFCEIGIFVLAWYCEYSKWSGHWVVTGQGLSTMLHYNEEIFYLFNISESWP